MNQHTKIQTQLYEYLRNELPADTHRQIEAHLAECTECRSEADCIASVTRSLDQTNTDWSALQPPGYWSVFANRIEDEIKKESAKRVPWYQQFGEWLDAVAAIKPRDVVIASAICTVLLVAGLNVKRIIFPVQPVEPKQQIAQVDDSAERELREMRQYLSRSKALLVGLANMKMDDEESIDFDAERSASRLLLDHARHLKQYRLDSRSERLIGDIERIFLKVANTGDNNDFPDLELIRNGIERENLLYKIRRAETEYKTMPVEFASNNE